MKEKRLKHAVTCARMAEIDREAQEGWGIPGTILMENAGGTAYRWLAARVRQQEKVVFCCGAGSNGGDALVMARHCMIEETCEPVIVLCREPLRDAAAEQHRICAALGIEEIRFSENPDEAVRVLSEAAYIVDGLTGTGLTGPVDESLGEIINAINSAPGRIVSVDLPSGLGDSWTPESPMVQADWTLTMEMPKTCLYVPEAREKAGQIVTIPVGFPPELVRPQPNDLMLLPRQVDPESVPKVYPTAYKNSRGVVAVFGGGADAPGAGILTAAAAGRGPAGMVILYTDPMLQLSAAAAHPAVIVRGMPSGGDLPDLSRCTAAVLGPGWGLDQDPELIPRILDAVSAGVLDADALTILSENPGIRERVARTAQHGEWIMTPHPGEYARLCGVSPEDLPVDPIELLRNTAVSTASTIVLKGHVTYVASPSGETAILDGMCGALGTAGSGDVLSGILGGLLSTGMGSFEAATLGVTIHLSAATRAVETRGAITAEELIPVTGEILREMYRLGTRGRCGGNREPGS
jgi:ADP-dependent NAD(P)H-hydrate dehydratase / NAD(P)H-hydrate epimerase